MAMKTMKLIREDIHRGNLILVNRDNPIKIQETEIKTSLVSVCNTDHLLYKKATELIHQILNEIDSDNEIVPVSCFRSRQEQKSLYNDSVRDNGFKFTNKYVAKPDKSEHQSGLAIDLGKNKEDIDFICPEFPYYGVFNEFRNKAVENGFIERYKEDKEYITGISKEPWHFRYIGYPHSAIIEEKNFALEEYHEYIKNFNSQESCLKYIDEKFIWEIFYHKLIGGIGYIEINDYDFTISGNNMDGFIITKYRVR